MLVSESERKRAYVRVIDFKRVHFRVICVIECQL